MNQKSARRLSAIAVSVMLAGGLALTDTLPAAAAPGCTGVSVPGDVNGDNRGEVAVTEHGRGDNAGAIHVFYGTSAGLVTDRTGTARDDQFIDQGTPGVPGTSEPHDQFGYTTAFGDFDADGCADLAVAAPGEDGGTGAVTVLYGSPSGLAATRAVRLSFASMFGAPMISAGFGESLAVEDLNHDTVDDLAIGVPGLTVDGAASAGGVAISYGKSPTDPGSGEARPDLLTRSTPGVPGDPFVVERFGRQLAAADFDGDFVPELAILGKADPSGLAVIQTVERGPGGYTDDQPDPITQQAAQAPAASLEEDDFGLALAADDFNDDGLADLAVGAPGRGCLECDEEYGYGEVIVLPGTAAGGVTTSGRQVLTQNSPGIPGTAEPGDGFGAALASGDYGSAVYGDLAIGAPEDNAYTGSVTVLRGSAAGLSGAGAVTFTQDTPGIGGAKGPYGFGGSLAAAHVEAGAVDNLIIGADGQDIGGVRGTGLINQLDYSPSGPKAQGSRTLHLDTAGVKGKPARNAQFGFELS